MSIFNSRKVPMSVIFSIRHEDSLPDSFVHVEIFFCLPRQKEDTNNKSCYENYALALD